VPPNERVKLSRGFVLCHGGSCRYGFAQEYPRLVGRAAYTQRVIRIPRTLIAELWWGGYAA
jgi:hypothetical protein